MIYCLNSTHNVFKTGSRRLKLWNVSTTTATIRILVANHAESVKIFFLPPLLKVLVLIVCWLCYLSGILDKVYLSLLTQFSSKSQPVRVCTNLLGYYNFHDKKGHLRLVTKVPKGEIESNFFVTPWISSKLNHNGKGHVLPTLIQFHIRRTSIVKVTLNGCLALDTLHCSFLKRPPTFPESGNPELEWNKISGCQLQPWSLKLYNRSFSGWIWNIIFWFFFSCKKRK